MPESFHFLYPQWLWLLLPLGLLLWRLWHRADGDNPWRQVLDPGLQPLLLDSSDDQGRRGQRHSLALLAGGWIVAVLALANPVWERVPSPVYQSQTARVVVLDLSLSMLTRDIAPDRLTRARFKVEDILRLSGEGQVGLVVFAGDAFTVTPLTNDAATLRSQLRVLEPAIMPVQGSRADLGLRQAGQLLRQAGLQQGQVLLLADGVEGESAVAAATELRQQGYRIEVLGVGTAEGAPLSNADGRWLYAPDGQVIVPKLEERKLREIAVAGGGAFVTISDDDSDVRSLLGDGATAAAAGKPTEETQAPRWRERGPWLVLLLLPLAVLAFRRGWLFGFVLIPVLLTPPPPALAASDASANDRSVDRWAQFWRTPEQLADQALRNGDYAGASALAQDPLRRGVAHYRQGDYTAALADFEQAQGAQASYNRGNALARLGRYQQAIQAYQEALAAQPGLQDAEVNKKAVEDLLERLRQQQQQQQQQRQQSPEAPQDEGSPQDQAGEQADQQQGQSAQQSGDPSQSQGQPQAQQQRDGQQGEQGQQSEAGEGQDGESQVAGEAGEAGEDSSRGASADAREPEGDASSAQAQTQTAAGQEDESQPEGNDGDTSGSEEMAAGSERDSQSPQQAREAAEDEDRNVFAEALDEIARGQESDEPAMTRQAGSAEASDVTEPSAPSTHGQARAEQLNSEEQLAAEQWLRRIPDDPGGLLRRKFQYQYQQRGRGPEAGGTQGW